MYIWVILAVFMVTLASFHVPVRNDMADFTEVPRADAPIVHFIKQHEAARDFVRNNFCLRTTEHDGGPESAGDKALELTIDYPEYIAWNSNEINFSDFIAAYEGKLAGNYVYTSEIKQKMVCKINSCTDEGIGFIISFMRISDEWLENITTGQVATGEGTTRKVPNIYFRRALMSRTGSRNLGYTQPCEANENDCSDDRSKIVSIGSGQGEVPIQNKEGYEALIEDIKPSQLKFTDAEGMPIKGMDCQGFPCLVLFDQVTLFGDCPRPVQPTPDDCSQAQTLEECSNIPSCVFGGGPNNESCVARGGDCMENDMCPGDQTCHIEGNSRTCGYPTHP